mgnify:CR=1 FL=1
MFNKAIKKNVNQIELSRYIKSLISLMKPRVMSLVIFTCAVGFLTSNPNIKTFDAIIAIILVALGSGAAGCLNMWYEADVDALMTRTCLRPIPTGKINKQQALLFGIFLTIFSVSALYYFTNFLSAFLLFFTIAFYLFVYTIWLKRKTPQNIVIGGIAGSLPPVIGWAISTNSVSIVSVSLFLIIFFWTPSHFWALSLYKADDYKKAKIPMMPITDGTEKTKFYILVYSLLMLPVIILPYAINFSSLIYFIPAMMLTVYYNFICYDLYRYKKNNFDLKKAKKVFGYSILYLFLIFLLFLVDHII